MFCKMIALAKKHTLLNHAKVAKVIEPTNFFLLKIKIQSEKHKNLTRDAPLSDSLESLIYEMIGTQFAHHSMGKPYVRTHYAPRFWISDTATGVRSAARAMPPSAPSSSYPQVCHEHPDRPHSTPRCSASYTPCSAPRPCSQAFRPR